MTDIDLNFLARQNAQILAALADMRDNYVVVTGMLTRIEARLVALETRMASLETSVNALARQIDRIGERVRTIEAMP
jgi:predicted  nucleic acid-binding Zn-ribbon protein